MSVGSPTAGTWSSSQWWPDNEFETDRRDWPAFLVILSRSHTTEMKSKVHPTYKTKYRVANWPAYNRALVRRGDVTVWVSSEAIAAWTPRRSGRRGGQRRYSDLAIETALTLRLLYHLRPAVRAGRFDGAAAARTRASPRHRGRTPSSARSRRCRNERAGSCLRRRPCSSRRRHSHTAGSARVPGTPQRLRRSRAAGRGVGARIPRPR